MPLPSLNDEIFHDKVGYLYRNLPVAVFANVIFSILMPWYFWETVPIDTLLLWVIVANVVLAGRMVLYLYFTNRRTTGARLHWWLYGFAIGSFMTSALWGLTPWLFSPFPDLTPVLLLAFVMGGMAAGAAVTQSAFFSIYIGYLVLSLGPLLGWFINQGDTYSSMSFVMVIALIGFAGAGRSVNKMINDSFRLARNYKAEKERAENATRAKSNFLSSMSHELRTPLNAILGFTQLLEMDRETSEQGLDYVKEVTNAGQYLLYLIDELLEISRIEAGKVKLNIDIFDAGLLLDECVSLIQTALAEKYGVTISYQPPFEPIMILADEIRLKQVLLNLLSNACKYNKQGGDVAVSISSDKSNACVSVKDTGKGIPVEMQEKIFESYQRLGQDESGIQGTGLGLMITRQLIQVMHGDITFESYENEGTTFSICLPLASASSSGNGSED